jgi:hypothetical protein
MARGKVMGVTSFLLTVVLLQSADTSARDARREQWQRCTDEYVALVWRISDPSDVIAEGALHNCLSEEGNFRVAQEDILLGQGNTVEYAQRRAREFVAELRDMRRRAIIAAVQLRRAAPR